MSEMPLFESLNRPAASTPEPEHHPERPHNPHVGIGEGLVNPEQYEQAVARLRQTRKEHPLWANLQVRKSAQTGLDLYGQPWRSALDWALKHENIPAAKRLTPTVKIRSPKTLNRYGGNANADRALPPEKD